MKITKYLPLIGVLILAYLIYKIGLTEIINAFKLDHPIYLIPAILIVLAVILIQTYKWNMILKVQGYKLPFTTVFKIQMISVFYGFITPARAGSIIRAKYLKELTGKSLIKSSSNTIIERILDLAAIMGLAFLGVLFFMKFFTGWMYIIVIIIAAFGVFSLIFLKESIITKVLKKIHYYLLPKKYKQRAKHYFEEFYSEFPKRRKLILPFLITIISWLLIYTIAFFVALSLNIDLPYHYFLLLFPITTLFSMLPISPSGLGVREVTLVAILGTFGVPADKIVALSLLSMIIGGMIPALIGFLMSLKKKV